MMRKWQSYFFTHAACWLIGLFIAMSFSLRMHKEDRNVKNHWEKVIAHSQEIYHLEVAIVRSEPKNCETRAVLNWKFIGRASFIFLNYVEMRKFATVARLVLLDGQVIETSFGTKKSLILY